MDIQRNKCIFTAVFFENTVLYRYTDVPIQLNLFMACIFLAC